MKQSHSPKLKFNRVSPYTLADYLVLVLVENGKIFIASNVLNQIKDIIDCAFRTKRCKRPIKNITFLHVNPGEPYTTYMYGAAGTLQTTQSKQGKALDAGGSRSQRILGRSLHKSFCINYLFKLVMTQRAENCVCDTAPDKLDVPQHHTAS